MATFEHIAECRRMLSQERFPTITIHVDFGGALTYYVLPDEYFVRLPILADHLLGKDITPEDARRSPNESMILAVPEALPRLGCDIAIRYEYYALTGQATVARAIELEAQSLKLIMSPDDVLRHLRIRAEKTALVWISRVKDVETWKEGYSSRILQELLRHILPAS